MIDTTATEPATIRRPPGLTNSRRKLLALLIARHTVSYEAIINELWGDCIDGGPDDPTNTIRAHVCYLRSFLARFDVAIETAIGLGYRIPTREMRDAARAALEIGAAEVWSDRRRASAGNEIAAVA